MILFKPKLLIMKNVCQSKVVIYMNKQCFTLETLDLPFKEPSLLKYNSPKILAICDLA